MAIQRYAPLIIMMTVEVAWLVALAWMAWRAS